MLHAQSALNNSATTRPTDFGVNDALRIIAVIAGKRAGGRRGQTILSFILLGKEDVFIGGQSLAVDISASRTADSRRNRSDRRPRIGDQAFSRPRRNADAIDAFRMRGTLSAVTNDDGDAKFARIRKTTEASGVPCTIFIMKQQQVGRQTLGAGFVASDPFTRPSRSRVRFQTVRPSSV